LATDSKGDLFVADGGNSAGGLASFVKIYGPSGTTPTTTIGGFEAAVGVTVDTSNNLWVLDEYGGASFQGLIYEYLPPYTGAPIKTLTSGALLYPTGLQFGP